MAKSASVKTAWFFRHTFKQVAELWGKCTSLPHRRQTEKSQAGRCDGKRQEESNADVFVYQSIWFLTLISTLCCVHSNQGGGEENAVGGQHFLHMGHILSSCSPARARTHTHTLTGERAIKTSYTRCECACIRCGSVLCIVRGFN